MPVGEPSNQPYRHEFADIVNEPPPPQKPPPQKPPRAPVTFCLIVVNMIIYGWMATISGNTDIPQQLMLSYGADQRDLTLAMGQYWRLVSCMFLHWSIIHIASNMYCLWLLGRGVEWLYGRSKMFFIYMVAGVAASLTSMAFGSDLPSAGASGAVFGMFGALPAFYVHHKAAFRKDAYKASINATVINLLINVVIGMTVPGIDIWAHIGGFIFGALVAFALMPDDPRSHQWTRKNIALALLACVCIYLGWRVDLAQLH